MQNILNFPNVKLEHNVEKSFLKVTAFTPLYIFPIFPQIQKIFKCLIINFTQKSDCCEFYIPFYIEDNESIDSRFVTKAIKLSKLIHEMTELMDTLQHSLNDFTDKMNIPIVFNPDLTKTTLWFYDTEKQSKIILSSDDDNLRAKLFLFKDGRYTLTIKRGTLLNGKIFNDQYGCLNKLNINLTYKALQRISFDRSPFIIEDSWLSINF